MPTPDKYGFYDAVLYRGIPCHITSRHGQPSSDYKAKWPAPGFYYNLREDKTNKMHTNIHHRDLIPIAVAVEHDHDRLVAEKAD